MTVVEEKMATRKMLLTRIILAIHFLSVAIVMSNLWRANHEMASPFIPQVTKSAVQNRIGICLILSSTALIVSTTAHYYSKNILSMCISAITIIYIWAPGLLPFLPQTLQLIVF
jgi:hypothetical protein